MAFYFGDESSNTKALGNADEVMHAREMVEKVNQWRAKEARAHLASRAATAA